ncbi:phenylacetate-CoA ligase/benzoylacetate-CoA ligase [Halarchaeum rubridurum]|uniref:Phenylacetate--CoA ligase n=1 Tax=Halarchaeum rubridurum TaxID=489911 RepID=A0A830FY81_9EURY|nr:phenylacetate--CoA ligase family protein [Halarchaeum rubridurum]MBP1954802.1 phenylacetate-CoA ligase/benzoylacetate-CoA ligase [Halarchaeum rubridurum]GGM59858.1 phenylacetate--CoA ligase [Halarchaeum rubridurum]
MADVYDEIEVQPWDDVLAEHERLLPKQFDYLVEHSDYYRRRFDEWGVDPGDVTSFEDLRELPFMTKQDERDCQEVQTAAKPLGKHQTAPKSALNRTISSSGTTGKPTYFGLTAQDRRDWNEVQTRAFYTAGVRPEDTVLFGAGQTMVTGGTPYFESLTKLGANVVPAGGESTERLLSVGKDINADVLWTTTSHIRYLGENAEDVCGVAPEDLSMHKVIGGAGPGIANPEIRQEFYDTWDASLVREGMGLGDILGCMWAECEEEDGMHFHAQGHVHVELIDPETGEARPFEDGAEGELVYTHLRREATPLVRFRSGDYAKVTGTECACGRTAPKMQCIGRADDMLIYKGMNVFPSAVRDVVSEVEGAAPRIRVLTPDADKVHFEDPIEIEIAREAGTDRADDAIIEDVVSEVRGQLKVRVDPTIVDVEDLPPSEYKTDLIEVRA